MSERIPLERLDNEILVKLTEDADKIVVLEALGSATGLAPRSDQLPSFDEETIIVSRPLGSTEERDAYSEFEEILSTIPGVAWTAPVLITPDGLTEVFLTEEIAVSLERDVNPEEFFATGFGNWRRFFDNQYIGEIAVGGGLTSLEVANELSTDPRVEWATPNFICDYRVATVDPLFGDQWNLHNSGQSGAKNDADVDLPEAWGIADVFQPNHDIVIAVLDNGVQTNHPDLSIFINSGEIAGNGIDDDNNGYTDDVNGWDFAGNFGSVGDFPDNNPNPTTSFDNHGTAVAGVAGATVNNGVGISGAGEHVSIMPVKIARDPGTGGGFLDNEDIANAVYYAAGIVIDANRNPTGATWDAADILVNSWGGSAPNSVLTDAFDYILTHGRGGKGVASFNASGNFADGTRQSGSNYRTVEVPIAQGNWVFDWRYTKNGATDGADDTAWLANIHFPNGTKERFDSATLPTGWSTFDAALWTVKDDPLHAYGTGRYVMQAGDISHNQSTALRSPTIAVGAGGGMLRFSYWVSSEAGGDFLNLFGSNNGGAFTQLDFVSGAAQGASGWRNITTGVMYPANIPSTIAVGASTDWDYRAHLSQYGSALDFVAPSAGGYGSITTTDRTGEAGYNRTGTADPLSDPLADLNYTSRFNGTSAATPLAAGIGALMLSVNPNLTAAEIRNIMRATADKIGGNNGNTAYDTNGFNQYYGYGRVNAEAALEALFTVAPTGVDLANSPTYDTGVSSSDNITKLDNSASNKKLQFTVTGTLPGAHVRIYSADNQEIGFAVASGTTTVITTDGAYDLPDDPAYTIHAKQALNLLESFPVSVNIGIDTAAPQVTNVIIGSTTSNPYGTNPDYEFDGVVGTQEQLRTVPVGRANQVSVQFSEDVDIASGDLEFIALNRVVSEPGISSFVAPDVSNDFTATWTLASQLVSAQYLLRLPDSIEDRAGNALDGEWTNPGSYGVSSSSSTFPSGDGTAGGDFEFVFTILTADGTRDNQLLNADLTLILNNWGLTNMGWSQGDYSGNGVVENADLSEYSNSSGMSFVDLLLLGDFDGDDDVDANDEALFDSLFSAQNSLADLDGNGIFNAADEAAFDALQQFGIDLDIV